MNGFQYMVMSRALIRESGEANSRVITCSCGFLYPDKSSGIQDLRPVVLLSHDL